ncbi:PREDICTED: short neuropeptide F-like isoform X2 [Dinoponera quadriceps]|nr:PREDICTED: short neuropeptide F-like isoform X2 [Dinoponera quadriceps]
MDAKRITGLIAFVVIVGFASANENYMDYGDEPAEKTAENIRELYRLLLQRNALDNIGIPLEHLMIRKSQRSPSLRLRFGRSGPHSAGVLPRPMGVAAAAGYDDNN